MFWVIFGVWSILTGCGEKFNDAWWVETLPISNARYYSQ